MTHMSLTRFFRNGWVQAALLLIAVAWVATNPQIVLGWLSTISTRAAESAEELMPRLVDYVFDSFGS